MSRIAGIIYPNAFHVTEMIGEMQTVFPSPTPYEHFQYKNLELAAWETPIATNQAGNIRVLIDGEIYNKAALTLELKKLGFKFFTESDAELVVHAYDAWKEAFLDRLNGPFALALFDEQKEILMLARDRLGQKPLYWINQREYWLFSTEIKGLLATGIVPQTVSNEGLAPFLHFGFIPQDLTPIPGVNKLLPSHFLRVDLDQRSSINQFWSLSHLLETKNTLTKEDTYNQLGQKMEEAVRISLPPEGKVGLFLLGNLGSSAMGWFLSHLIPRERICTYSAVFEEPDPIDAELASKVAETLSLKHESKTISPDDVLDELPKIVWHLDEPVADPFTLQTWFLGKMAAKECAYTYADLGWEEMFGGNTRYFADSQEEGQSKPPLAFSLARLPTNLRDRILLPSLKAIGCDYLYRILRNIDINHEQVAYIRQTALFKDTQRKKVSPILYKMFDPEVFAQRFHRLSALHGSIDPSLYYDAKTELPDRRLLQYARLLSPHNLQLINPYLDARLVELLAKIPDTIKFESKQPGALLHHLMVKLCHACPPFPEKSGSFMDTWRTNGRFRAVFEQLCSGRLVDEGMISERWIRQQLALPYLTAESFEQLWALLVLEIWFRFYISRPIDKATPSLTTEQLLSR